MAEPLIQEPMQVLGVLLAVLALLFIMARHERTQHIFRVIPLLIFAYFVPTVLSNSGLIPVDDEFPLYRFISGWLLPASLVLLVLSVDVPAILGLGKHAVLLFLFATLTVVAGGPLAYAAFGWLIPAEAGEQAWRGLAALSGSWIGGTANFVAVGKSVGVDASTISLMIVVDVAVANVWMAFLLSFAARQEKIDARLGADRSAIEAVKDKVQAYQKKVSRPTNLPDLLVMCAIAFGLTAIAHVIAPELPQGEVIGNFFWIMLVVTTVALGLSFTRVRDLEGAGASQVGSVFLYLLVASIGAKADFGKVFDPDNVGILAIGGVWMAFHALLLILFRRLLRAPIFFLAVGSQANIGGAASAPIVAHAFHPSLAPVGVLLAVGGYLLGIYGGIACAFLLRTVHQLFYATGG